MSLHITILERQSQPLSPLLPPVIIDDSGTIGRSAENDLVLLDDPAISRTHAKIRRASNEYIYEDLSTNGSINTDSNQLIHQTTIRIYDGLKLRLGQYLITFAILQRPQPIETPPLFDARSKSEAIEPPTPLSRMPSDENSSPLSQGNDISGGAHHLDLIFKAAGLPICHPDNPEMAAMTSERIGRLLKAYTQGLKKALDARATVKDELHAARTLLGARDNNPLKFIRQDSDSLQELVLGTESTYRTAELAIEEAFNDLIAHEMALFAAIQHSAKQVIGRFSPNEIEESVSGGIGFQRKMKCWDTYSEVFPQMAETALDDLLGKAFLQAYEEQLLKIKTML